MSTNNSENSRRAATDDTTINLSLELPSLLFGWAAAKGKDENFVGKVPPITELFRILELRQRQALLDILERAYQSYEHKAVRPGAHDDRFAPLKPTLATYLMNEMLKLPEVQGRVDAGLRSRRGEELSRYKIKVLRNSFLWLDKLMKPRSKWVDKLLPETEQECVVMRLRWLLSTRAREFCKKSAAETPLTENEKSGLENLWRMFDGNRRRPIQFAFCLARLELDRNWSGGWAKLVEVVRPLTGWK